MVKHTIRYVLPLFQFHSSRSLAPPPPPPPHTHAFISLWRNKVSKLIGLKGWTVEKYKEKKKKKKGEAIVDKLVLKYRIE